MNIRLYSGPHLENKPETLATSIKQLNYLGNEIHNNELGYRMQEIFPEGFVFTNVLYGLSCAEIAAKTNFENEDQTYQLGEARFAFEEINSESVSYTHLTLPTSDLV